MDTTHWRQKSQQVIAKVVKELPEDATPQQIKQAIDKSYPFGSRENHPYKIWLDERRKTFYDLGLAEKKPDKKGRKTRIPAIKCDHVVEGQLSLFYDDKIFR
ncbi:hypothetical protein Cylst_2553 [Cylindrospermum stagnale PCC 7417]|uniref:Uncharacterized protein n=1 Tax=Cylindrospermum stagnale PCC 7417 TaxID=56107 RepID=K9WWJ9_9NOST|nr:hypothetical protein [Cylindrospermum stagnale]AFZ24760.1 hypothetical protein Cylst_2553 [Cylindrospermum stagnale PCC 7417]